MNPPRRRNPGFTLLEMMLSIAVFLLLITSAFSLVGATTELITEVSEAQKRANLRLRFADACRSAFEASDANSSIAFDYVDRGGQRFDTYLSLVNVPGAFDFGRNHRDEIERVVVAAEIRPDGWIRARVYYFNAADFEQARQSNFTEIEAPWVELIPQMRQLQWRFYDPSAREWRPTMDRGLAPSLIELTFQIESGSTPLRTVFYLVNRDRRR